MVDKSHYFVNIHGAMKPPLSRLRIRRHTFLGFSLVEVVLALGVMSFALTSMLAILPTGLNIFRESVEASARADILRKLTSELQQTSFKDVQSTSAMRYFTDEGLEVTDDANGFFGMTYSVSGTTDILSGSPSGGYPNGFLKSVKVEIFTRADREKSPSKASFKTTLFIPESGI